MVVRLRPMTEQEFQRWQEASIRSYAAEHVKTGRWSEEASIERARREVRGGDTGTRRHGDLYSPHVFLSP